MPFIRSVLHALVLLVTLVPYALVLLAGGAVGAGGQALYRIARAWLSLTISTARTLLGIQVRVTGMEHLPQGQKGAAVLLVKHQSTFETFLMPALMPHPLAYVFKKELLRIPFFGWAIGRLDMIHIDRKDGRRAFQKVVAHGKALLEQGTWVTMFPEGTRVPRGYRGQYKSGGTRLAIQAGVPVIPIAVTSAKCWPRKAFIKFPGVVDVSIGPMIDSTGRRPDELMLEVENWIEAEMRRLDPEAYPADGPTPLAPDLVGAAPASAE